MTIYLGADHRGFQLKEYLREYLQSQGYSVVDVGNVRYEEGDDYPDFAAAVAERVSTDFENSRGIVICGSGIGADIVANKFPRIRSALVMTPDQAFDSRSHDDANILALGADYLETSTAKQILSTWLTTPASGEGRHERRISKISEIEGKIYGKQKVNDKE